MRLKHALLRAIRLDMEQDPNERPRTKQRRRTPDRHPRPTPPLAAALAAYAGSRRWHSRSGYAAPGQMAAPGAEDWGAAGACAGITTTGSSFNRMV